MQGECQNKVSRKPHLGAWQQQRPPMTFLIRRQSTERGQNEIEGKVVAKSKSNALAFSKGPTCVKR